MQTSHSPSSPERLFRASILNGITPSPQTVAALEARGINVGELEQRIRHNLEPAR